MDERLRISPRMFAVMMRAVANEHAQTGDAQDAQLLALELMVTTLASLGYGEGLDVYEGLPAA